MKLEMKKVLEDQYAVEKYSSSRKNKEEICSALHEGSNSWPYRMKLTTDQLRWDSLKISHSKEFEDQILRKMNEASHRDLDGMIPVEISIYDVDICETYKVTLVKKEAFWFEPFPLVGEKSKKDNFTSPSGAKVLSGKSSYSLQKERTKEFAYSIEPFRHIVKKRNLDYQQEIGLRWSGSKTIDRFDFSVLSSPRLSLYNSMI